MSCAVSALECGEDPLAVLGRHAGSVVANADLYAPGCTGANFDEVGRRRELQCVLQQVDQDPLDVCGVGKDGRNVGVEGYFDARYLAVKLS